MRTISLVSLLLLPLAAQKVSDLPARELRLVAANQGSPALLFLSGSALYFGGLRIADAAECPSLMRVGDSWLAAYVHEGTLYLASSAEQWRPQRVTEADSARVGAAPDGTLHFAVLKANTLRYGSKSKWTAVPPLPNFDHFAGPMDLRLDSAGNPGIAFVLGGEGNSVGFWRPGRPTARVIDTRGQEVDDPDVQLAFEGDRPRVLYHGKVDELSYVEPGHDLWLAKSSDDGINWESSFRIPADAPMPAPISMTHAGAGKVAIVTRSGMKCSANFQRFTSCGPALSSATEATAIFSSDGTLWIAYSTPTGLYLTRLPKSGQSELTPFR